MALNNTLDQVDLTFTHRTFHPKTEYTLSAHGRFFRIGHMVSHKTSLSKFEIEILSSVFSYHHELRHINFKKKSLEKYTNTQRLNNMLLNKWFNQKNKERKYMEKNENMMV